MVLRSQKFTIHDFLVEMGEVSLPGGGGGGVLALSGSLDTGEGSSLRNLIVSLALESPCWLVKKLQPNRPPPAT